MISWNENGKGSIMLHGHCHHSLQSKYTLDRMIDVGIDGESYGFKPIHIDEIFKIVSEKSVSIVDHHDSKTSFY